MTSGPQGGPRGVDGNKKVRGIKRHVLTCSLGFVLALLVTAANAHDTQPVEALLDRAVADGWKVKRAKVDGIYVGPRMAQAATEHGVDAQVTTRERDQKGFKPLPLRWRIEATFGTLANRWHRLTRNLEQSTAAAEDAVSIANCHRVLRAYHRPRYPDTWSHDQTGSQIGRTAWPPRPRKQCCKARERPTRPTWWPGTKAAWTEMVERGQPGRCPMT